MYDFVFTSLNKASQVTEMKPLMENCRWVQEPTWNKNSAEPARYMGPKQVACLAQVRILVRIIYFIWLLPRVVAERAEHSSQRYRCRFRTAGSSLRDEETPSEQVDKRDVTFPTSYKI